MKDRIKNRSFTLIELLLVIGIITILLSMLLPTINKARNKVKAITCVSNLKQYSLGFFQYALDYADYIPRANPSGGTSTWLVSINPYVFKKANVIFTCPAEPANLGNGYYGFNYKNGWLKLNAQNKVNGNWFVADAKWYFINPPSQAPSDYIELRHDLRANFLMMAGNVKLFDRNAANKDLWPFSYGGTYAISLIP